MPHLVDDLARLDARPPRPRPLPYHRPAARPRAGAGLLVRHVEHRTDSPGAAPRAWWLLGLRRPADGGRWANLGGSIDRHEWPAKAAAREFTEETGWPLTELGNVTTLETIRCGTDVRPYTMFVVDAERAPVDAVLAPEHTDLAWFPTASVDDLDNADELHAPFAAAWALVSPDLKVLA